MRSASAILGCLGPRLRADERVFFREAQPWGFILFARNLETPEQVRRLTSGLREAVGWEAPILIDQEGGRVQRMGPPHWRQWLPPLEQVSRLGSDAARSMGLRSQIIAHELRAVGIDVNCTPMADVADHCTHHIIQNRCYGMEPEQVAQVARAVADGLLAGGVLPVLKHMPGHGRAYVDSHRDLPVVSEPAEALWERDFAPFTALSDLKIGMTAHLVFQAFDPERPATQSHIMIDLIRNRLGFGGLLLTDDISMEALQGSLTQRAEASLSAGVDIVLHCNGDLAEMQEIVAASGTMSDLTVQRAEAALAQRRPAEPDAAIPPLEEVLDGLLARAPERADP